MAVIAMLLLVAIIALLASALMARQTAAIHTTQNEQIRLQGQWLLRGEISRSQMLLRAEALRTPVTRLDGAWSRPVAGKPVGQLAGEPARIYAEVTDEQARFNLRNLIDGGDADLHETRAFLRLCALVGVSGEQATLIARRVVESLVGAGRRADAPFSQETLRDARFAARAIGLDALPAREQSPRLRDLNDLLGVPGIDPAAIGRLQSYVTILPQRTWINANTAGPEVLAAWIPGLTLARAQAMLASRNNGQWFINRGDFARRLQMPEIDESDILIGITSQWFRLSGALRTSQRTLLLQALLYDDKASLPQVVWLREGA
ncbi:MAG TPA: type II secretion system minor pseudopilin GspK [Enterobacteriaceae bacterium]|nr:type II secretion system minor pseudopilin GspK [Enterobacteriaceae bacterium]